MRRVEGMYEKIRCDKSVRRKNYERRRADRKLFSDSHRYGRALLDLPKSGELSI